MGIVLAIGTVLQIALRIYIFVLWARFVLDWILVLNRRFRPRGVLAVLIELVYTLTDPPIKMFRRVLPPIRIGQISLDLGWMLTLLACWILLALIPGWA
ncbi:YggT family protein [Leucobacter allii]|uniref:YggT family protein n=1 Tax=Leucobacter allii TaxID=2932247 RepID=A0ABY4FPZ4_9MICO|nr:YggT family protein [Leucobacter allii]UOQ58361.1 YggT family protein [Leucobacter allii]UOR02940.1 YggT family protein [Leucobacter allii]